MKIKMTTLSILSVILCWASLASAQIFTLPTLNNTQTDPIFNTLAADLAFRPVQPASDMGLWGVSVGISGTMTSASQISSIVGSGTSNIYNADISGTVQLPFGIAVEAGILPNVTMSGTSMNQYGGDVKWTITRDFLDFLPFDMSLRGMYTKASLAYSQNVSGSPAHVNYSSNMTAAMLSVSKDLFVVNPYLGYGLLQHSSTLTSDNTGLFGSGFAAGTSSASGSGTSGWLQLGLQFKLTLITLAAEYDHMFNVDSYSARLAFAL